MTLFSYSSALCVLLFPASCHRHDPDLRLSLLQDFFAVYGPDAIYIANNVYRTHSVIKYMGPKNDLLPYVTMSIVVTKTFLREALTAKQLRVEIYSPEGTGKKSSTFKLSRQVGHPISLNQIQFEMYF